jgi:hypothetical protein
MHYQKKINKLKNGYEIIQKPFKKVEQCSFCLLKISKHINETILEVYTSFRKNQREINLSR